MAEPLSQRVILLSVNNMLNDCPIMPTLPAVDLNRAKEFYEKKLGLQPMPSDFSDVAIFECGDGTCIQLYRRGPTKADHTVATFEVQDIETKVNGLRQKGVTFEEYDSPPIKTVNGIATIENVKSAWFKDSEGNILCLHEFKK